MHLLRPIELTPQGEKAFCSGGDQSVRGEGGYDDGSEDVPRLRVLDLQVAPQLEAQGNKKEEAFRAQSGHESDLQ